MQFVRTHQEALLVHVHLGSQVLEHPALARQAMWPLVLEHSQRVQMSTSAAQASTTATRMRLARTRSAASHALAMLDTRGREQAAPKMTVWVGTAVTSTPSAKTCQG